MTAPVASDDRPDGIERMVLDGDLLLWRGTYTVSRAFEAVSRGWYSHVAFIVHWEHRPMVLQAGAFGIQAVPLHETVAKYHGLVEWFRLQDSARQQLNIPKMINEATSNLGLPFGLPNALRELFYRVTGVSLFRSAPNRRTGMFCAEYVSKCFKSGGLDLVPHKEDIHTFPDDIANCASFLFRAKLSDTRRSQTAPSAPVPVLEIPGDGIPGPIVIPGGMPRLPIEPTATTTPAAGRDVAAKPPAA